MGTTRFEVGNSYFMFYTPAAAVHDDDDFAVFRVERRTDGAVWLGDGQSKIKRKIKVIGGVECAWPGGRGVRRLDASRQTSRPVGFGPVEGLWL